MLYKLSLLSKYVHVFPLDKISTHDTIVQMDQSEGERTVDINQANESCLTPLLLYACEHQHR